MLTDIYIHHKTAFASGSTMNTYRIIPYDCTLRNVTGIVQADPGDDETVTITGGGAVASGISGATNALGTLTFGSAISSGATGTWAADATTGSMTLLAGSILKMASSSGSAAADCDLTIELDPHALS